MKAKLKEQEKMLEQQQTLLSKYQTSSRKSSTVTTAMGGTPKPHMYVSSQDPRLNIDTSRSSSMGQTSKATTPVSYTNSPRGPLLQPSRLEASIKAAKQAPAPTDTNSFVVATSKPSTVTQFEQQQPMLEAMQYFYQSNNRNPNHLVQQGNNWLSLAGGNVSYGNSDIMSSSNTTVTDQLSQPTSVSDLTSMLVAPNYQLAPGATGLFNGDYLTQIPDARSSVLAPNVNIGVITQNNQLTHHTAPAQNVIVSNPTNSELMWRYQLNEYNNTTMQYPTRHADLNS